LSLDDVFFLGDIINESKFFAKYFKDEFILITSYTQNVSIKAIDFDFYLLPTNPLCK
jgi:hypothetical protein